MPRHAGDDDPLDLVGASAFSSNCPVISAIRIIATRLRVSPFRAPMIRRRAIASALVILRDCVPSCSATCSLRMASNSVLKFLLPLARPDGLPEVPGWKRE
jgi:hypothetical protein